MEELEVFKTQFFQRLCEERETQLKNFAIHRFQCFSLRGEIIHDSCQLPPVSEDMHKYEHEIVAMAQSLLNYANDIKEQSHEISAQKEVNCEDKIADITKKLKPKWTLDSLEDDEKKEPLTEFLGSALYDLYACYNYLRENVEHILDEIACIPAGGKDFCLIGKFFDLEKTYRGLTEKHYNTMAIYTAVIRESRKNIPGAEEKRRRKKSRKEEFINLLKEVGLYDRDKLRNLKKGTDRKTRMLFMEKARTSCDVESDRTIQNYIKEIIRDLSD